MRKFWLIFLFVQVAFVLKGQHPLITKYDTVNADTVIYKFMHNSYWQAFSRSAQAAGFTSFANGNILLVWCIFGEDIPDSLVYYVAQQLDSKGNKVGKIIFLDTIKVSTILPYRPSVIKIGENSFAYSFESVTKVVTKSYKGNCPQQYYRKYNLQGIPLSKPIRIDTTIEEQFSPSLHLMENGKILVGWHTYKRARFRIFDADGIPLTKVLEPDSIPHYERTEFSIQYKNKSIVLVWEVNDIKEKTEKIYLRIFDELGKPKGAPIAVDEKQTILKEFNPQVCISNDRIYVGWITDKQDIRVSFDEKIKDSCSIRIASFSLTGKRLSIKTCQNLPVETGADELRISENQGNILLSWWSLSSIKNDSCAYKVSGVLINSKNENSIKKFDLLFREGKFNSSGFTFDFPDAEFTETGDLFVTWYGNMDFKRIPGDVYYAITSVK